MGRVSSDTVSSRIYIFHLFPDLPELQKRDRATNVYIDTGVKGFFRVYATQCTAGTTISALTS